MKTIPLGVKWQGVLLLFVCAIFLGGCARMVESWYVSRYDGAIRRAGQAIAASRNNTERAAAYADRADAYSEKARYLRLMKLIPIEEYAKLFDLAVTDYNQAIALDAGNAEKYYRRGNAYYSRASLDMIYQPTSDFLAPARADFSRVAEADPRNAMALDMLGLTDGSMGDWTAALADFEREAALKPEMHFRISDAYCNRGSRYPRDQYEAAISDLNRALESRGASDACECEPYNPLVAVYLRTQQYDKVREIVSRAQRSKQWIEPEYLAQLKAASGK
jgi:tetratricopeptide (TPR) repeat protein